MYLSNHNHQSILTIHPEVDMAEVAGVLEAVESEVEKVEVKEVEDSVVEDAGVEVKEVEEKEVVE